MATFSHRVLPPAEIQTERQKQKEEKPQKRRSNIFFPAVIALSDAPVPFVITFILIEEIFGRRTKKNPRTKHSSVDSKKSRYNDIFPFL
jgi:hypothetical protein